MEKAPDVCVWRFFVCGALEGEQGLDKFALSLSPCPVHYKCAFQIELCRDMSLAGAWKSCLNSMVKDSSENLFSIPILIIPMDGVE
ncbi:hypothetical protein [Acetobacter senegalensis]|uniref:hypothetical protein n=1 Tax=Acetobacter senegalensis TaxID=446692 RepID=UPI002652CE6C|nr:hypothetical protein [Acetobacter senegalensis]MDN7350507.1 hypothetical protein [Acetobacter senegalensis]